MCDRTRRPFSKLAILAASGLAGSLSHLYCNVNEATRL